jgi:predicted lipoprotein
MSVFNARFLRVILLMALVILALPGCVLATVRTLDEDEAAKVGFSGETYVESIWDSQVLPTYREKAQDIGALLDLIAQDQQAAIDQYGSRSGTGAYSFMVRGEGAITTFDTSSRAGLALVDLNPPDGTPDVSLTIGPLIKISQRAAVRDAVGFIEYGNFVNQQEFADVANAMGDRITAMLADALGAESVDAIRDLDPASVEGKTVSFIGAFTLEDPANIIVVPVILEVVE